MRLNQLLLLLHFQQQVLVSPKYFKVKIHQRSSNSMKLNVDFYVSIFYLIFFHINNSIIWISYKGVSCETHPSTCCFLSFSSISISVIYRDVDYDLDSSRFNRSTAIIFWHFFFILCLTKTTCLVLKHVSMNPNTSTFKSGFKKLNAVMTQWHQTPSSAQGRVLCECDHQIIHPVMWASSDVMVWPDLDSVVSTPTHVSASNTCGFFFFFLDDKRVAIKSLVVSNGTLNLQVSDSQPLRFTQGFGHISNQPWESHILTLSEPK